MTFLRRIWQAVPLWRAALCLLLTLVSWLAVDPAPPESATLGWDKLNHASAFAALAVCAAQARIGGALRIVVGLLAYGVLIELVQSFVPNRSADAADLLADAVGLSAGLLLARALTGLIQPR